MGKMVKIRFTFHFYPLSLTFGAFGVQTWNNDCDQFGRPIGAPSVLVKRPHPLLQFHTIFPAFSPLVEPLQGEFKKLGLRQLAWVSGSDPRKWGKVPKGVAPLTRLF